jgi:hypothetical protein
VPQIANTVVPRWTLLAFEIACILAALAMCVRMRRERERGSAGLLAGIACFVVAAIATIAIERAVDARWIHAPGYHVIAESLVLAGVLGLATCVVARITPWIGARRYLAIAIALPLVIGIVLLGVGAAELAWIWIVPATCAAAAPFVGRARVIALASSLLPAVLVLAPTQLREAAWNGFASPSIPLAGWLLLVAIPPLAAVAYMLRDRRHSGPLGTLVLFVGWALAITIGILMLVRYNPPCSTAKFRQLHLTCESVHGV